MTFIVLKKKLHDTLFWIKYYILGIRSKKILFDHIPKCGGTSLKAYLSSQYPKWKIFLIIDQKSIESFKNMPKDKRLQYDLIQGHSANKLIDYVHPDTLKITMLRDPIDRIISHYYYVKRTKFHYLHKLVLDNDISLEDYVNLDNNITGELRNYYTVRFSELSIQEVEDDPKYSIQLALNNIQLKYDIIGFLDNYDAFMRKLIKAASVNNKYRTIKKNVTNDRPKRTEISEKARLNIREMNKLDIEFYNKLKKLKN